MHGWTRSRPKGVPLLLLTPQRYPRVLEHWRACRKAGEPWLNEYLATNVIRDMRTHAKWAGLKLDVALTVHSLRKSCGQNWANHLPMNVVPEFMGHSEIKTTAEFCTTVSVEHAEKARWVIEAVTMKSAGQADARMTPEAKIPPNLKVG